MKKTWIMLLAAIALVLVACSDEEANEPKDVEEKDSHVEDKTMKEKADDVSEADEDTETEVEKKESEEAENDETEEGASDSTEERSSDSTEAEKSNEDSEENAEDIDIVEFGFDIFEAQANEDYDFIESVLSKGSSLDRDNNIIHFENVTYPHDYEFISKRDFKNLSQRYIQEEDSIIVGFDVTDYENESSYIIDTEFIKEDGEWKLNDMDINK